MQIGKFPDSGLQIRILFRTGLLTLIKSLTSLQVILSCFCNAVTHLLQEIATILNITVSELVRDDAPQVSPVAHCPHCGHELTVELK